MLAERAAWDFACSETKAPELVTILPVAVLGPVLGDLVSGTNHLLQQMLNGGVPGFPGRRDPDRRRARRRRGAHRRDRRARCGGAADPAGLAGVRDADA